MMEYIYTTPIDPQLNNNGNIILLKFKPNEVKLINQIPNNEAITSVELKLYYYSRYYKSYDNYKNGRTENLYLLNMNPYYDTWDHIGSTALFGMPLRNYDINSPLATGIISDDRKYKSWTFNTNLDIFSKDSFTLAIETSNNSGPSVYFSNAYYYDPPYSAKYHQPILEIYTAVNSSPAPVPEPSSIVLGLISLGGIFGLRRRKSPV